MRWSKFFCRANAATTADSCLVWAKNLLARQTIL